MNQHLNNSFFEKFENRRPVFKGIEKHYKTEVVPRLKDLDKKRESTILEAIIVQLLVVFLGFLFTMLIPSEFAPIGYIVGAGFTIAAMIAIWSLQTKSFKLGAKDTLIGGVVSFFDWAYSPISDEPAIFKRLSKLRLFSGFDSKHFSDRIDGIAFERKFTLTEILLTRTETNISTDSNGISQTETRVITVFNGCLISIKIPEKFQGETIVLRRAFLFNPKKIKGLKKVGLLSSKFEKDLNVYGTDQVESRYLLPPTLIEQVIAYEKAFKGKNIRFAFIEGQLHIVVETGNRFEFRNMFESMLDSHRIKTLLSEIEATFALIEGLLVKKPKDWEDTFGHDAFHTKGELNEGL